MYIVIKSSQQPIEQAFAIIHDMAAIIIPRVEKKAIPRLSSSSPRSLWVHCLGEFETSDFNQYHR